MAIVRVSKGFVNTGWNVGDVVEMDDKTAQELAERDAVVILEVSNKPKEVVKHGSKSKGKTKNSKRN